MATENEIRSRHIMANIGKNRDTDLRETAAKIGAAIAAGETKTVLKWFNAIIDINHATLHGLGTEQFTDRPGGWGFAAGDAGFLDSLRFRYLGHAYGVRGGGVGPLTKKQIAVLARIISSPFYTMQMAMVWPAAA